MSRRFRSTLTFDDVSMCPQYNNIPSRTDPSLETHVTRRRQIRTPILVSNMDSVICEDLAKVLLARGSLPIFHRFAPMEVQTGWVKKYGNHCFISCGFQGLDQTRALLELGAGGVCIDVAHGHSEVMLTLISELKRTHPAVEIIAGNVCTAQACHDLINAGADAIKVGIGPGAACTTRLVTGAGVPQFSAILDCAEVASRFKVPLISDGGHRRPRDLILALAAGASCMMMGYRFALTNESAAPKRPSEKFPGRLEAKYRGQASADFQQDYYGRVKEQTVPEGVSFWDLVAGPAAGVLDDLEGAIRSGMTYSGARNFEELRRKAEFVEVTHNFMVESHPQPWR